MTMTLSRHLLEASYKTDSISQSLGVLFSQLAFAGKKCAREVGQASLTGKLGLAGGQNSTGDSQKKLDIDCHEIFKEALLNTHLVWAMVSEEVEDVVCIDCQLADPEYLIAIDPIDGSSNIDINGYLGTIFGIFPKPADNDLDAVFSGLKGRDMIAAGYILYGASVSFVYSAGEGVHAFNLDRELGEFILSHENIEAPQKGQYYCTNQAHLPDYAPELQDYVAQLSSEGYSLRYSGALVADFHRVLLEGGIFLYPGDQQQPEGKLRLLYEGAPLAYLAEQSGARGTDGKLPILDIPFQDLHQRIPVFLGTEREVQLLTQTLPPNSTNHPTQAKEKVQA